MPKLSERQRERQGERDRDREGDPPGLYTNLSLQSPYGEPGQTMDLVVPVEHLQMEEVRQGMHFFI